MNWRLASVFAISVGLLGYMAYRHWGPTMSHIDSSRYVLPTTDAPSVAELVGPLDIEVDGHHLQGATGSIVNYRTVTLLLTAKHLFGDVSDVDMPSLVKRVSLTPTRGTTIYTSNRALYLSGAVGFDGDPSHIGHDVAAMLIEQPVHGLTLATDLPAVGDPVRIELNDGSEVNAQIVESAPDHLGYLFQSQVVIRGTSGAPILDRAGQVVGVHLGGGGNHGVGNPSANIIKYLAERIR